MDIRAVWNAGSYAHRGEGCLRALSVPLHPLLTFTDRRGSAARGPQLRLCAGTLAQLRLPLPRYTAEPFIIPRRDRRPPSSGTPSSFYRTITQGAEDKHPGRPLYPGGNRLRLHPLSRAGFGRLGLWEM